MKTRSGMDGFLLVVWAVVWCLMRLPPDGYAASETRLTIGTVEEPPGNYTDSNGDIIGLSVDFVREIQKRVNNRDPIRMMPGARLIHESLNRENVVIFSLSRTPEREDRYHWISLVMRKPLALFARKDDSIAVPDLESAKQVDRIGVLRSSVQQEFLEKHGFSNIVPANTHFINLKKLAAGRLNLMYHSVQGMAQLCRRHQMDFTRFKTVLMPQISLSCIAMSRNSDPDVVVMWQQAARDIKTDGTFDRLAVKWRDYTRNVVGVPCEIKDGALQFWQE